MNIRVDLNYTIKDGSEIVFRSPVDCSAITGLVVYYVAEDGSAASREFVLTDAHGHDVGDIDHLFSENVVVKVILDVTAGKAYVLNADTNAYIESSFIKKTNGTAEFFTVTELGVQDHTGDCKFTAYWEEEITDENGMPTGQVFSFYGAECDESVVLRGIHDPIMNHDAATKRYVDRKVAEVGNGSGQNVPQMEPVEDDIPCVYLYTGGAGMPFTKDEGERQVRMVYESRTQSEEYYLTAKVQGSSSASNPNYKKRNWTFKFYTDSTYEKKLKLVFKGWPAMNKFVLKAGWVIPGHLRNVGAAKVWGQIMRTRADFDSLPEELRKSPNLGATDGFHVRVFIDGQYWGIYDWIVAKDQLFGQDKDNPQHSILNSELNNQPTCAFATTTPTISGNWAEELLDNMTADTKTSMEDWIKFVAGATDEEFVANAENYFDVQSVIDAICFDRIMLTVDNMCRNQIVFKYDKKWYMGKWDLDAILGLPPVAGQAWYPYNTAYQEGYVAHKDYGIINMLYKRTEELFMERFKARYWELRNGPLSENNLNRTFGKLSDRLRSIEGLLAEENASTTGNGQFTGMPNVGQDTIQQIREFVVKRCAYMDFVVGNMILPIPCTGITLDKSMLAFTGAGTQALTATVTPENATDAVLWSSDNTGVASVSNVGVVTAVSNGTAIITATCGAYSAICSVSVDGIGAAEPVYSLAEATTFNGSSDHVDTGIKLYDTAKDWTVLLDADFVSGTSNSRTDVVFDSTFFQSPWPGFSVSLADYATETTPANYSVYNKDWSHKFPATVRRLAVRANAGVITRAAYILDGTITDIDTSKSKYVEIDCTVLLGCARDSAGNAAKFWEGTINQCKIYFAALPDEQIDAFLMTE